MRNSIATLSLLCTLLAGKGVLAQPYTIGAYAVPGAGGEVKGRQGKVFNRGDTVTLTAVPSSGYIFSGQWQTIGGGTTISDPSIFIWVGAGDRIMNAIFLKLYTLSTTINIQGAGTVTGPATCAETHMATLVATPAAGYGFVDWTETGNVVSTEAAYTFRATTNRTLVANFKKVFTVATQALPAGSGTATGDGSYLAADPISVTATAATGYGFINWTEGGNVVSAKNPYTFPIGKDRTLVANFKKVFVIATTAKPAEGGRLTGGGDYFWNDSVTVKAIPATGYTFVNWTQGANEVSTNAAYSFVLNQAKNLVANFKGNPLTITANSIPAEGGMVANAGTTEYGKTVSLKAVAARGFDFTGWMESGNEVSTDSVYTFTATKNRTLVARFKKPIVIATTLNPAGSATMSGAGKYYYNDSASIEAVAKDGFKFKNWTLGGVEVSTNPAYKFNVTKEAALVANFLVVPFSITSKANPANSGTVTGAGNYNKNTAAKLTASPASGYTFIGWTENDSIISTSPVISFSATGSRKLVANFSKHYIGEPNLGGIIYHLWNDSSGGMHGLVVSTQVSLFSMKWRNLSSAPTGAVSTSDGFENSQKIMAAINSSKSAADVCRSYRDGGLSDWYLPAIDELKALYDALPAVNARLKNMGLRTINTGSTTSPHWYWSSTESDFPLIWCLSFSDGKRVTANYYELGPADSFRLVCAIRKF